MQHDEELTPGTRVPGTQYIVQSTLGRGGHGVVLAVEHAFLGKRYVMKVLHAQLADRDEVARRMRDEARILARIEHPNIVQVVDGGMTAERDSRPYFVMAALRGEPLLNVLRRRGVGIGAKASLHVALDVLDALDAAHMQHHLVHRDIKPANIFLHRLSPNEVRGVLLDFGVARVLASPVRRTQGPTFLGTLRYAAPEQLRGEATFSSDLYAVGICLFETLTGKHPLGVHRAHEDWVRAHTRGEPLRLRDCIDAPSSLETLLARALAKQEQDRFPSAYAMAGALRAVLEELPEVDPESPSDDTEAMVLEHALTTVSRKTAWVPAKATLAEQSTVDERAEPAPVSDAPRPSLAAFQAPERPSLRPNPLPETWKKPRPEPAAKPRIWVAMAALCTCVGAAIAAWSFAGTASRRANVSEATAAHPASATEQTQVQSPAPAQAPQAAPAAAAPAMPIAPTPVASEPPPAKPTPARPSKPGPRRVRITPEEALRLRGHTPIL